IEFAMSRQSQDNFSIITIKSNEMAHNDSSHYHIPHHVEPGHGYDGSGINWQNHHAMPNDFCSTGNHLHNHTHHHPDIATIRDTSDHSHVHPNPTDHTHGNPFGPNGPPPVHRPDHFPGENGWSTGCM